jgi:CRISPR system Cascade subunit CasC
MFVELHILQSFPPSCLNRDDTNTPKDCMFGGIRRARVSSQCWKRAVRMSFRNEDALMDNLAIRTKRLVESVTSKLRDAGHADEDLASIAETALGAAGLATAEGKTEKLTQYLLFLPERSAADVAMVIHAHFDDIASATRSVGDAGSEAADGKKARKKSKADAKQRLDAETTKEIAAALYRSERTPEIALFGRMIADKPDVNVDAAAQVAHAISTNEAAPEFDFYTAVDDLKTADEDAGADMLGTIGYTAPCFYRYAVVDTDQLARNLAGGTPDEDANQLAATSVAAFCRGFIRAIPSARQNSMAAHTPPSLVVVVTRHSGQPVSLANAFEAAVQPRAERGVVGESILRLGDHWEAIGRSLGQQGVCRIGLLDLTPGLAADLHAKLSVGGAEGRVVVDASVDALVAATVSSLGGGLP